MKWSKLTAKDRIIQQQQFSVVSLQTKTQEARQSASVAVCAFCTENLSHGIVEAGSEEHILRI